MPRSGSVAARVLLIAFLGEGTLGLAALLWVLLRHLPVRWGNPGRDALIGVAVAALLAAVQYGLLHHVPAAGPLRRPVRALHRLYAELLRPLFAEVTAIEIVGISLLAGAGEELFFRGAVQQEWGWTAASVLFGLCHVGSRETLVLGAWAAVVGGLLGWLTIATGGLTAAVAAHAVYDALALSYIRWGLGPGDGGREARQDESEGGTRL